LILLGVTSEEGSGSGRLLPRSSEGRPCPPPSAAIGIIASVFRLTMGAESGRRGIPPGEGPATPPTPPWWWLPPSEEKQLPMALLKVYKNENFFGSDFEFCSISLLVMLKLILLDSLLQEILHII
jgi:hypothetical protein